MKPSEELRAVVKQLRSSAQGARTNVKQLGERIEAMTKQLAEQKQLAREKDIAADLMEDWLNEALSDTDAEPVRPDAG